MTVVVIFKDDLDNKTVKQVETPAGNKVGAPGAEIEVLDSYNLQDTDTHYYVKENKYLKHVETGAVWAAQVAVMKKRGEPVNEELTPDSGVKFVPGAETNYWRFNLTSALSGYVVPALPVNAGNYTDKTGIFAQYANAKEANADLATKKLAVTTNEYFLDTGDHNKVLATTFELPYPELPYREGKAEAYLTAASYDGHVELVITDSDERQAAEAMEKTYHYKYTDINGKVYEGTKVSTAHNLSVSDFESTVPWYMIEKAEYSVEPFHVTGFFFDEEIAPEKATVQNLVDHL